MTTRTTYQQGSIHLIALLFLGFLLAATIVITPAVLDKRTKDLRSQAAKLTEIVPDELMIRFRPQVDDETKGKIRAAHRLIKKQTIPQIGVEVVNVAPDERQKVMETLVSDPSVESVESNAITRLAFAPNDPYFNDGKQWAPQKIQAPAAWDISMGNNVKIAIIDFGVDAGHPDLAANIWTNLGEIPGNGIDDDGNGYVDDVHGYNFYYHNADTSDDCGHGTGVAGIAAAVTNNGIGIAGIAPGSMIMPIKAGSCGGGNYSSMISGLFYAADNGARVINISAGAPSDSTYLSDAVNYARSKGAIVVAAVGNDNSTIPFYPASYPAAFAVAGTLQGDMRYLSSNYGSQVDIAAPATPIYTTWWTPTSGSMYTSAGGTSDAAPHVAGLAALLFAKNPNYTASDVEYIIEMSADDLGTAGRDDYFGYGRINASRALGWTGPLPTGILAASPTPIPTSIPTSTPVPTIVFSSRKIKLITPTPDPNDTIPPTVTLSSPLDRSVFTKGTINLVAGASDNYGVKQVQFYVAGKLICSISVSPYQCAWGAKHVGTYSIYAKATDINGKSSSTPTISIQVN